jgi:transposase, IS5 family
MRKFVGIDLGREHAKVRYRGLAKNRQRLWLSCGLANLFIVRRRLLRT